MLRRFESGVSVVGEEWLLWLLNVQRTLKSKTEVVVLGWFGLVWLSSGL